MQETLRESSLPPPQAPLEREVQNALNALDFGTLIRHAIAAHERQVASIGNLSSLDAEDDVLLADGQASPSCDSDMGEGAPDARRKCPQQVPWVGPLGSAAPAAGLAGMMMQPCGLRGQPPQGDALEGVELLEEVKDMQARKDGQEEPATRGGAIEEPLSAASIMQSPKRRSRNGLTLSNIDLRDESSVTGLEKLLRGPFDHIMNFLIVASAGLLFLELEFMGMRLGADNGWMPSTDVSSALDTFYVLEHIFNACFFAELCLRLMAHRCAYFWDRKKRKLQTFNCLDALIVATCSLDLYLLPIIMNKAQGSLQFLRLLRLLRSTRALRVVRVMTAFSKLRILLNTTVSSFMSLFWAMIMMCLLMYGGAVLMCMTVAPSCGDAELADDLREWIFRYYGSSSRSLWTVFEITFSGGWPNYVRRLVEEVHWGYAIFFAVYVWVVVFAITRIITALFLKDTLQVASEDADMMLREQQASKQKYTSRLRELFEVADQSGDGMISLEEFEEVLSIPQVRNYFSLLDVQISEVAEMFNILANGDGQMSYDEFCQGVMRVKGHARAMDMITMMKDCRCVLQKCEAIERLCENMLQNHASQFQDLN